MTDTNMKDPTLINIWQAPQTLVLTPDYTNLDTQKMTSPRKKEVPKLRLIPWDPLSSDHADRLYRQRLVCGWDYGLIDEWKEEQKAGTKAIYWVVLDDSGPAKDKLLDSHVAQFPDESLPLQDTASKLLAAPRDPSQEGFLPIGHVGVSLRPDFNEKVGLPRDGVCWIKTFYVSWVLQGSGIGRTTMTYLESMMTQNPINATIAALDTVPGEWQLAKDNIQNFYSDPPHKVPAVSNEEWYERQGYKVFHRDEKALKERLGDSGEEVVIPLLFCKKRLV
ncbi:hypothetical protein MKZ38_000363 [Zalerion maritima]|uniref:Uncharacterized protein n=1 Tax=Zalerion maritima TaxID=339359 RepID=A0AAD5RRL6_9PEZI|nr:hypothetical protein MKZ38_000363 [Zalerion maritima]